ncbi:MAG: hypothetical protein PVH61_11155 [Candidatus Aminicenantes bacterium]
MRLIKIVKFVALGIFLLVQVYLFLFKNFEVLDYYPYINQHPLPLFGENKDVSQEFRTPGPLARIDIMMANYKIKPKEGILRLTIYKTGGGTPNLLLQQKRQNTKGNKVYPKNKVSEGISKKAQLLFLKNYPAKTVEDNRFYSFKIDKKIPAGNYRLQLNYFPKDKRDKLAAWSGKRDLYPFGNLYANGKQIEGDMTFRVYYKSTIWKERDRWLTLVKRSGIRGIALAAGFILMIVLLNLIFYYFLNKLVKSSNI